MIETGEILENVRQQEAKVPSGNGWRDETTNKNIPGKDPAGPLAAPDRSKNTIRHGRSGCGVGKYDRPMIDGWLVYGLTVVV